MKKIILSAFFAMAVTLGFSQLQVNLGAGYLNAKGNQLDLGVWGGGVAVKGLIGNNFSIGVGVRAFPKKEGEYNVGNTRILRTNNVFQAYVPIEYLIANKSSTFQPYIGADLGLQHTNTTWADIQGTSSGIRQTRYKKTYVYTAPKVGFNFGISPSIGLFGEVSYGLTFGDNDNEINLGTSTFTDGPAGKHFLGQAGLYFRIGG